MFKISTSTLVSNKSNLQSITNISTYYETIVFNVLNKYKTSF